MNESRGRPSSVSEVFELEEQRAEEAIGTSDIK
jgi:hypothetical protein